MDETIIGMSEEEKMLGIRDRVTSLPYPDRHLGYPICAGYYRSTIDLRKMRRKYRILQVPILGWLALHFI